MTVPSPATPAAISNASERAQIRHRIKTYWRNSPCLKINAFCAPIAIINESPRKKPVRKEAVNFENPNFEELITRKITC